MTSFMSDSEQQFEMGGTYEHMSEKPEEQRPLTTENHPAPLSEPSKLGRLAAIGVVILCVVGIFLYLGGWFSPHQLTQARFVNGFQKVFGFHSGFPTEPLRNPRRRRCVALLFAYIPS
jgi:hypothetical protein